MNITISIAGLNINFCCDQKIETRYISRQFIKDCTPEITINVVISDLPEYTGEIRPENECHHYVLSENASAYYSFYERLKDHTFIQYGCFVQSDNEHTLYLNDENQLNLITLIGSIDTPKLLLERGKLMFHCACIEYHGKAILFTAPSGTGKSTQADLWNKYEGTRIINGDRMALGIKDNKLWAFATPYCGTSFICENIDLEVAAIVCLSQAPENSIDRINGSRAYMKLYEGAAYNAEFPHLENIVFEILSFTLENTPIFHLKCTPDKGAVDMLKSCL